MHGDPAHLGAGMAVSKNLGLITGVIPADGFAEPLQRVVHCEICHNKSRAARAGFEDEIYRRTFFWDLTSCLGEVFGR